MKGQMKKKIAALALTFLIIPFEGQASSGEGKTDAGSAEHSYSQEFRLPGAPSGGYRGDYRYKVRAKGKSNARKRVKSKRARSVNRQTVRRSARGRS